MKTVEKEFKYKGWDIKITKTDAYPSHPYEWELRKEKYEILDPTSFSDFKSSEGAAKEVVDFYEEPKNKHFLDNLNKEVKRKMKI